ncbi:MAG: hypothetical protein OQK24_08035 [Magnetovibrio sp.]|nr:hypothetical protein [Magnetovibrio sp.]
MNTIFKFAWVAVVLSFTFGTAPSWAQTPQTDVEMLALMGDAPNEKKLAALEVYYELHVSESIVQHMNERRTGAMFAIQRAQRAEMGADEIAKREKTAKDIAAEREAKLEANMALRLKLEQISGIEFAENLVMIPDAPMAKPAVPVGVSADLIKAQAEAWSALQVAQSKWQEQRLIMLEAQQRYDETRDVPIGDHFRAMTEAETNYAIAIGACRMIEARIAAQTGKSIGAVLGGL